MALHRSWLCDDDEVCVETTQMTLCTEHSEDPDVKCVLQEGLYIDGKPVWACAPVVDPPPDARHGRSGEVRMSHGDAVDRRLLDDVQGYGGGGGVEPSLRRHVRWQTDEYLVAREVPGGAALRGALPTVRS